MIYRLAELDPAGLKARLETCPALVLPMGTIEWHSHHLPLGLDGLKAEAIAERTAERSGAALAPTAWWAAGGVPFPYTLRLPGRLVEPLLREALSQLVGFGFRAVLVLNGHYGLENTLAVRRAALEVTEEVGVPVLAFADYELLADLGAHGDHAGTWETSLLWAVRPELVRLDGHAELPGVVGDDPRGRASEEMGRRGLEVAAARAAGVLEQALGMPNVRPYAEALRSSVQALENLWQLRQERPRDEVPPVQTPAWFRHLQAMRECDWHEARAAAEDKVRDPLH